METFFLTFGQKYRDLKDHWVEIEDVTYRDARAKVVRRFGIYWADLQPADGFISTYYPAGALDLEEAVRRHPHAS